MSSGGALLETITYLTLIKTVLFRASQPFSKRKRLNCGHGGLSDWQSIVAKTDRFLNVDQFEENSKVCLMT